MGRGRWTTAAQTAWLAARIPEYAKLDTAASAKEFHTNIYNLFTEQWPVDAPTHAEINAAKGDVEEAEAENETQLRKVSRNVLPAGGTHLNFTQSEAPV